jgi:hypothetical protein
VSIATKEIQNLRDEFNTPEAQTQTRSAFPPTQDLLVLIQELTNPNS